MKILSVAEHNEYIKNKRNIYSGIEDLTKSNRQYTIFPKASSNAEMTTDDAHKKYLSQKEKKLEAINKLQSIYKDNNIVVDNNSLNPTTNLPTYYANQNQFHARDFENIKNKSQNADTRENLYSQQKEAFKNIDNYNEFKTSDKVVNQKKNIVDEYNKTAKAYSDYQNKKLEDDKIGLYDKTVGRLVGGITSPFSQFLGEQAVNENGDLYYLPSYNDLKQQKVLDSYGDSFWGKVAKVGTSALYEGGKIATSAALNSLAPGVGTATYFGDIYTKQLNQAISEGYNEANSLAYATLSTATEYITERLLGGLSKPLFGKNATSKLSENIGTALSKTFMKNPRLINAVANGISEGGEEFIQEYIDVFNRNITLGEKENPFTMETLENAIYSGAVGALTGGVSGAFDGADYYKVKKQNTQTNNITENPNVTINDNIMTDNKSNISNESNAEINNELEVNSENRLKELRDNINEKNIQSTLDSKFNNIENQISEINSKTNNTSNLNNSLNDKLQSYYKITDDFSKAGFILDNGNMLDFSDGYIKNEHQDIENIVGSMDSLINRGTIRIGDKANAGILEIGKEPTNEQFSKIENFSKTVIGKPLDIELHNGKENLTLRYNMDTTNISKIRNDIKRYYSEGIVPTGTTILYNSETQKNLSLKQEQEQLINSWISNGLIDNINDPKINKWIAGYPSVFPNGKILSDSGNIKLAKGNIPLNENLLNKYSNVKDIFSNEKNNYDGNVDVKSEIIELKYFDINNTNISDLKKLANDIFIKYNQKNIFENNGNKIVVNKSGINESIEKIYNNRKQRNLAKEHLLVFSDLGDIIEKATLVNQTPELKNRENIKLWNYYFDGLKINGELFHLEFDVRSMASGENQYRVQRLEKNTKKTGDYDGDTSNKTSVLPPYSQPVFYDNNITNFNENVKLSSI